MQLKRPFALCLAVALYVVSALCHAEQITGQLHISLTILKRCELSTEESQAGVRLSTCQYADYLVRDARGQARAASFGTREVALAKRPGDTGDSVLEIYW